MSEGLHTGFETANVIRLPVSPVQNSETLKNPSTPLTDAMEIESERLDACSAYKSSYDWKPIRALETRSISRPIRGGFIFKSPLRLVNSHSTCQQCLYTFEIDTYGRGCTFNCAYCYARAELVVHGSWNNPAPAPIDINSIRKVFYTVFETQKKSKWRPILEKRIPIRIGSMSDSFMWIDDTFKVTKELLRILNFYRYPYVVFTRSDLIAKDDYLSMLDRSLSSVQFSISSTDDKMNRLLEPGAPSAQRRLSALSKLTKHGIWTSVRINPFFPMYPDGYFTNPSFQWSGQVPVFKYSSIEMVDEIANSGCKALLAGVGRFSRYSLNQIEKATGFNLRQMYDLERLKSTRDFHYSDKEIRHYYQLLKERCNSNGIQFSTCYLGNGEEQFWADRDLWSNKLDCCNIKKRVAGFVTDCRQIPFSTRLKLSNDQSRTPNDSDRLHELLDRNDPVGSRIEGIEDGSPNLPRN